MSDLAELAASAVERAVAAGAGDAEAYASEAENREVRVHGGEVESLTAATQRGLACSSAMTKISLGPARLSMSTSPNTRRLAAVT